MAEIFLFSFNAVAPIVCLIFLGYFFKSIRLVEPVFFKEANRFVYRLLLPVLMFSNIYEIESLASVNWSLVGYAVAAIAVIYLLGLLTVKLFVKKANQKGVILQVIFRSNYAFIGIPLAELLGGAGALANASILAAVSVPLYNVLAVISLSVFSENGQKGINWKQIFWKILKNPIIIGCMAGGLALVVRSFMPVTADGEYVFTIAGNLPFVYKTIENLAKIASPLALIAVGGQFELKMDPNARSMVVLGTVWRIVLAPLLALLGAVLLSQYTGVLSFGPAEYPALIALFGSPAAVASAVMAQEMGADGSLARQLVVWSSIGSAFTLFLIIAAMRYLGLL